MNSSAGKTTRRKLPTWLIPAIGWAVSIGCLIWVYHGFDWKRELPRIRATDLRWVTLAVVADIAVYCTQGWRWSLLLSPIASVPVWQSIQAVYVGLFANEVLPLRSGEIIRSYLQSKWSGLEFGLVISSVLLERLIDGVWLILAFYICSFYIRLPNLLVQGAIILAVVLLICAGLLAVVVFLKHHAHAAVRQSRWKEKLWHVVEGLHAMGNSRSFYRASLISLLYLFLQIVPIYALMRGFGLKLNFAHAAVVLIILRLGSVPPQAPGNVGSFQALTKLGLMLFGISKAEATGFATLLFFVVTVPLWLAGFVALAFTGMSIHEIHRDAHEKKKQPVVRPSA